MTDPRAEGWRIWKWTITVTPKGEETTTTTSARAYSIRKWIAAQLLYLIENQAVRKFTVVVDSDGISEGADEEGEDGGGRRPARAAARDPIMVC